MFTIHDRVVSQVAHPAVPQVPWEIHGGHSRVSRERRGHRQRYANQKLEDRDPTEHEEQQKERDGCGEVGRGARRTVSWLETFQGERICTFCPRSLVPCERCRLHAEQRLGLAVPLFHAAHEATRRRRGAIPCYMVQDTDSRE